MSELFPFLVLEGEISPAPTIQGEVNGNFNYQSYTGDYTITPAFRETVELQTKDRVLNDNVVVKEIPYYETPTLEGGTTIYIGLEA